MIRFIWDHRWHLFLTPFLALTAVTLAHELSHALFVVLQGGVVTELSFLPGFSGDALGHIRYRLSAGGDDALVAFGPTLVSTALAGVVAFFGLAAGRLPGPVARTLFVWGYLAPIGDIAWSVVPWLDGAQNDLSTALGRPDEVWALAFLVCFSLAGLVGFGLQRRLYGPRAL